MKIHNSCIQDTTMRANQLLFRNNRYMISFGITFYCETCVAASCMQIPIVTCTAVSANIFVNNIIVKITL